MIVNTQNYTDFKAIYEALAVYGAAGVFVYSFTGSFSAYALLNNGSVFWFNASSAPSSFATDFPNAVTLNTALNL